MQEQITYGNRGGKISLQTLALSLVVACSFLYHLFIHTLSASGFVITIGILILIIAFTKRVIFDRCNRIALLWLLAVGVVFVNFGMKTRTLPALLDIMVLLFGTLLVIFHPRRVDSYTTALKIIRSGAIFFTIGILLQICMNPIYEVCLSLFPGSLAQAIREGNVRSAADGYMGFTTNTGFASGYIIAGLISVVATFNRKKKKGSLMLLALFAIALLFTGKRGPVLFLALALMLCVFLPARGMDKFKKYANAFLVVLVIIIVYFVFEEALRQIPFVGEVVNTINGLIVGEDVSSARSGLYAWAVTLFLQNPVFGIGWGNFRSTVIGNVTIMTSLEAHNVYLQLLCETGIVGFSFVVTAFAFFWLKTKRAYVDIVHKHDGQALIWKAPLFFAFVYQTFFLLYCLTANPFYDQFFQIMYFFSCAILMAYRSSFSYEKHRAGEIN